FVTTSVSSSHSPSPSDIYTLSLHDALPIWRARRPAWCRPSARSHPDCLRDEHGSRRARRLSPRRRWLRTLWRRDGRLAASAGTRSEEHTSELQSRSDLVCRLLLEKKNNT